MPVKYYTFEDLSKIMKLSEPNVPMSKDLATEEKVRKYPTEETFRSILRTTMECNEFNAAARTQWKKDYLKYRNMAKEIKKDKQSLPQLLGIDQGTRQLWKDGTKLAERDQMIQLALAVNLRKDETNDLLRRYGYRELYPLDIDDYITLFVLYDAEHKQKFTRDQTWLEAVETIRNKFPKRFFLRLLWKEHILQILEKYPEAKDTLLEKGLGRRKVGETKLRNWTTGKTYPPMDEIKDLAAAIPLYYEDAMVLFSVYNPNGLTPTILRKLNELNLKAYTADKNIRNSILFSYTLEECPERLPEEVRAKQTDASDQISDSSNEKTDKQKRDKRSDANTVTFSNAVTLNMKEMIAYYDSHPKVPHEKVTQLLTCYMEVWFNCRPTLMYKDAFPAFKNTFSASLKTVKGADARWANLRSKGQLPPRYYIILEAVLLDMSLSELNYLLQLCYYPPLNPAVRPEYLISYALTRAYLIYPRKMYQQRLEELEQHRPTLISKADKDKKNEDAWDKILSEHKELCSTKPLPSRDFTCVSSYVREIFETCLPSELKKEAEEASRADLDSRQNTSEEEMELIQAILSIP